MILKIIFLLIETFNTFGLIQMVDFPDLPTRGINILDIFANSRPGLIQKVEVAN